MEPDIPHNLDDYAEDSTDQALSLQRADILLSSVADNVAANYGGGSTDLDLPSASATARVIGDAAMTLLPQPIRRLLPSSLQPLSERSPALLPTSYASIITIITLAARVSFRASALLIEASLDGARGTTLSGIDLMRRTLFSVIGGTHLLDRFHRPVYPSSLQVDESESIDALDRWTNVGVYYIHHAFTLAELFSMTGFYLATDGIVSSIRWAADSVQLIDSIFGSSEISRTIAALISFYRNEIAHDGAYSSRTSQLKAIATLTVFACLQLATHSRSARNMKLRAVYDCTILDESLTISQTQTTTQLGGTLPTIDSELQDHTDSIYKNLLSEPSKDRGSTEKILKQDDTNFPNTSIEPHNLELAEQSSLQRRRTLNDRETRRASLLSNRPLSKNELEQLMSREEDQAPTLETSLDYKEDLDWVHVNELDNFQDDYHQSEQSVAAIARREAIEDPLENLGKLQESLRLMRKKLLQGKVNAGKRVVRTPSSRILIPQGTEESPSNSESPILSREHTPSSARSAVPGSASPGHPLPSNTLIRKSIPNNGEDRRLPIRTNQLSQAYKKAKSRLLNRSSDLYRKEKEKERVINLSDRTRGFESNELESKPQSGSFEGRTQPQVLKNTSNTQQPKGLSKAIEEAHDVFSDQNVPEDASDSFTYPSPIVISAESTSSGSKRAIYSSQMDAHNPEEMNAHNPEGDLKRAEPPFPQGQFVDNLLRYCRFSSAAYGFGMMRVLGVGNLSYDISSREQHINHRTIAEHTGIPLECILWSSYSSVGKSEIFDSTKPVPLVHYICLDHSVSAIVLVCRGTLGLSDLITDLTAHYEPIHLDNGNYSAKSFQVHSGMLQSARKLMDPDSSMFKALKEALKSHPGYGLIMCGHSLGGGVAALLSIFWSRKMEYGAFKTCDSSGLPGGRPIHCFTYGIPCVASFDLVEYAKGLVTSVVNNNDIVPTLSIGLVHDLKNMATSLGSEGKMSSEVIGRVVGLYQRRMREGSKNADGGKRSFYSVFTVEDMKRGWGNNKAGSPNYRDPMFIEDEDDIGNRDAEDWLWASINALRAGNTSEKLYPPGECYVIESQSVRVFIEESKNSPEMKEKRKEMRGAQRVMLRYCEDVRRRFSEPIFARRMLFDHNPANYERALSILQIVCGENHATNK